MRVPPRRAAPRARTPKGCGWRHQGSASAGHAFSHGSDRLHSWGPETNKRRVCRGLVMVSPTELCSGDPRSNGMGTLLEIIAFPL